MASTTSTPPEGPTIVKKQNGGARPGAGRPPKAENLADGTLPKRPHKEISTDDAHWWEWLDTIPADEWQRLICYCWRTGPIVDLSGGGKPITVEKIVHPFDSTYIYKTHGSGAYRFDVSEIPADGSKQRRIRQSHQILIDVRYPPRIPYGTWLDDARNKEWEWARPALLEEATRLANPPQEQAPSPTETMNEMLDMQLKLKELNGGDGNAVLMQAILAASDPTKQLALMKQMMEMGNAGKPQADPMMVMFMQMMMEDRKAAREEAREARAQQSVAVDPMASFDKVLGTLERFGVKIGGANAKANPGDTIAATIGDIASKVVDGLVSNAPLAIQAFSQAKAMDLRKAEIEANQRANPQPATQPWALPNPGAPQVAAAPSPGPQLVQPQSDQPMTAQLLFFKYKAQLERSFPFLADHFRTANGDDFREWLIAHEGLNLWADFKRDATAEMLTEGATTLGGAIFTPREKVLEFFTHMLDDAPDEDGQPGEGAPDDAA